MISLNGLVLLILFITLIQLSDLNPENEEDENYNGDMDYVSNKQTTKQIIASSFQVPDDKWTSAALKDIAHYLRNYKFNEWDRRYYYNRPEEKMVGFYKTFPIPMLRSLHWKVYKNCEHNFYRCITYLHSIIEVVPFSRNDDVITLLNEKSNNNDTLTKILNFECKKIKSYSEISAVPFDSPKEKFQWRTTASYFMCWYTMSGNPALSMLGDTCDNFANCLDPLFGQKNRDPRSDDRFSFACAMYSFCPDPCCPLKHIHDLNECYENKLNPCFDENHDRDCKHKKCSLHREDNNNLKAIVNNKWNVSCNCKRSGFIWKSQYGMCIDVNECTNNINICDNQTEACLNTVGSYKCICKWGYVSYNNRCIVSISYKTTGFSLSSDHNYHDFSFIKLFFKYIGIKIS